MDNSLLEMLARIAGIGGVAVGVLLLLFREVLRRTVFSKLSPDHSFQLLRLVVVLTGLVAIGGLTAWAVMARRDGGGGGETQARLAQLRAPIENLFKAWETKDLALYVDQWHPGAIQWIGQSPRSLAAIEAKRRTDFSRFKQVNVISHEIKIENPEAETVLARVTYSMRYQRTDGKVLDETDMRETYKLTYSPQKKRWLIAENFDYFATRR